MVWSGTSGFFTHVSPKTRASQPCYWSMLRLAIRSLLLPLAISRCRQATSTHSAFNPGLDIQVFANSNGVLDKSDVQGLARSHCQDVWTKGALSSRSLLREILSLRRDTNDASKRRQLDAPQAKAHAYTSLRLPHEVAKWKPVEVRRDTPSLSSTAKWCTTKGFGTISPKTSQLLPTSTAPGGMIMIYVHLK